MSEVQNCFRRVEKKYLLNQSQYAAMMKGMERFVEPDEHPNYTICNIYYDTEDYRLIRTSLDKPVYKEKLRVRSYGIPKNWDSVFVELKKKYDGVVYKRRITLDAVSVNPFLSCGIIRKESQISKEISWFMHNYDPVPKAFIGYDRTAFSGKDNPDLRITFDTNIRGRDWDLDLRMGDHGNLIIPENMVLMELKIPGTAPLWLAHLLSENQIYSTSFSKYGTYYKQMIGAAEKFGPYHKEERHYA